MKGMSRVNLRPIRPEYGKGIFMKLRPFATTWLFVGFFSMFTMPSGAAPRQVLRDHVPAVVAGLKAVGDVAGTNRLSLAIGLPLRNKEALTNLLRQIYDPASTNYHHFLTPEQFARMFGPTEKDYRAVLAFANANGLEVAATHPNRMLVDVSGSVADIQKAMRVTLRMYPHPHEARRFYAPDTEPSVDLSIPILSVGGLDNYSLPQPRLAAVPLVNGQNAAPNAGSGPSGSYMGGDFRAAYAPGVTLTGSGQVVGLLQFDGYTASDIAYYESQAGLPGVTLSNVLINGATGLPSHSGGEVEVSLDIEMAISMAPGLSMVVVYMAPNPSPWEDLLNRMATDNLAKQLSCSWYQPGGAASPTCDQIFQQMAAQGQSFYNASGDYDAYVGLIDFPGDTPYLTQVGGTTLSTTGPGGSWVSETVWNRNNGVGSGGGISTQYAIPVWQAGINMTTNQGSVIKRNTPDVALTAENVYVRANSQNYRVGGTSCSAPLWAGFTALINQQAINNGGNPVGFITPAIYSIGLGGNYATAFHDITTGDNTSSSSPTRFYAVPGYDLCTGWGTPLGQGMIDALVGPPAPTPPVITVQPQSRTNISGYPAIFNVTASGSFPLRYQWNFNGTNINGATNATLTLANVQPADAGIYVVTVTNLYGSVLSSNAVLTVLTLPPTITLQPDNQAVYEGFPASFMVVATGSLPLCYQWTFSGTNIAGATNITLTLANVQFSQAGNYAVLVTNLYGSVLSSNAALTVSPLPPCAPVSSSLVGWWPAEGNANDVAGANNGTTDGGVVYTNGEVGQAFVFNGTSASVGIPASSSLDVGLGNGLTFEGWIKPVDIYTRGIQILAEWNNGSGGIGVHLGLSIGSDGDLYANLRDTSDGDHVLDSAGGVVATNVLQHVALTYNKTNGAAAFYLNGVEVTNKNLGSFTPQTSYGLSFGNRPSGPFAGSYYSGLMDEISVYNRALTAAEIQVICAAGPGGKCPPTIPPAITSQPLSQVAPVGTVATFNVVAMGSPPLSYQWRFNGTNVVGATNMTLTLTNVQFSQAGNYAVLVTNLYGSVLSSNAVLTVIALGTCAPVPSGLVSWWPAEGNANDAAGTNNGTTGGGIVYTNGEVGQAFVFNGASTSVSIPASSSLNVGLDNGLTLEGWIKPVDIYTRGIQILAEWNNGSGGVGVHLGLSIGSNGDLYANLRDTSDGNHVLDSAGGVVATNVLQHVALTYNKTNGVAAFYLNGVEVTNKNLGSFTPQTSYGLYFGNRPSGPFAGSYYSGLMDEISVYNRALTAAEIQAIYAAGSSGKCPPSAPAIVTQPTNQTAVVGMTATFGVSAVGSSPLGYQWRFNGTNLAGATNATLTLTNVQLGQAGSYAVQVTNRYGSVLSSNAVLTVWAPGICTPAPFGLVSWWPAEGNANDIAGTNHGTLEGGVGFAAGEAGQAFVFNGTTTSVRIPAGANLDVGLGGGLTVEAWINPVDFTYQSICEWNLNDGNPFGNAQIGTHLELNETNADGSLWGNVVDTSAGEHIINTSGGVISTGSWQHVALTYDRTSGVAALYCNGAAVATTNLGVFTPQTSFDLFLGRRPSGFFSGIYFHGGMDEPSVYNRALTASEIQAIYVAGTGGKCTPPAALPAIVVQPTNQAVVVGGMAGFSVTASGAQPLGYQWSFNGTNLAGATNATLTLENVQLSQAGNYAVLVTNLYGSAVSSNAVLTVLLPPFITTQPSNRTVLVGETASFSVTAGGTPPLSYQWNFNGTDLNGATNATLTLVNVQLNQAGSYAVLVTNLYGSILSSNAGLTVNTVTSCVPVSSGLAGWWPGEGNANDAGGTNNGTLVNGVTFTNGTVGQAFAFDGVNSYVSVADSPYLDTFLTNITVEAWIKARQTTDNSNWRGIVTKGTTSWRLQGKSGGKTLVFSATGVSPSGDLYGTRNVNDGQWHHVAGVYDGTNMYLYVDGTLDASQAATGSITQNSSPLCIGQTANSPGYYFYGLIDEVSLYNRAFTAAEIQAIYVAGSYGKCAPNGPVIVTQPTNQTVTVGGTTSFGVAASGIQLLSYRWNFNGTNLAGATNATLTLTNVQLNQAGNYAVLVTNRYGSVLSSNAVLTVNPPPPCTPPPSGLAGWWPGEGNAYDNWGTNNGTLVSGAAYTNGVVGQAFSFNGTSGYVSISNSSSLNVFATNITIELWLRTYQTNGYSNWKGIVTKGDSSWRLQGRSGAKTVVFSASGLSPSTDLYGTRNVNDGLWHHVAAVYDGAHMFLYTDGTLDVSQAATGLIATNSYPLCFGENGQMQGRIFNGAIDEASIYNRALTATEVQAIYASGSNGKCPPSGPIIVFQPTNQVVAAGRTAGFSVMASGAGTLSYQWRFNGTGITGATNGALTLTNVQANQAGNYAVLVTNRYGSALSSNAVLALTADHFTWNPIPSPRYVNASFAVTIQARDTTNGLFTNFTGTAVLGTTNGIAVAPVVSGHFVQGTWTGAVVITQMASNLVLRADDGFGHVGLANRIDVINPPSLQMFHSGNIALYMWPVGCPGFVLEASGSLAPAAWVAVPYSPVQIGDQYVLPLNMNGTNGFYRLWLSAP
jgi:hypothetical protein